MLWSVSQRFYLLHLGQQHGSHKTLVKRADTLTGTTLNSR